MKKIIIEVDFEREGFEALPVEEQFFAVEEVLKDGAETNNAAINVRSIEIKN